MVDRAALDRYSAASTAAAQMAIRDLGQFLRRAGGASPDRLRDALLEVVPALVAQYGNLAAAAALEWYQEERDKVQGLPPYQPVLVPLPPSGQVEQSVRFAASHLYSDAPYLALTTLAGSVQRLVKNAGRHVVLRNAERDPAGVRYARVPRGPRTCAFCTLLASRGWVYAARDGAQPEARFHDHCDCELVPSFRRGEAYMSGYDPDRMYDEYSRAREALVASGKDPNDLSELLAAMRRLSPGSYTDGAGVRRSGRREAATGSTTPVGAWPGGVPRRTGGVRAHASLASTPRITGDTSFRAQVSRVNPRYGQPARWPEVWGGNLPYDVNCVRASLALVLRRMGYDVHAGAGMYEPQDGSYNAGEALARWTRDGQPVQLLAARYSRGGPSNSATLTALRRSVPDGAYGVITGTWTNPDGSQSSAGHIWCWEKSGGRILFWDGQTGKKVSTAQRVQRIFQGTLAFARLDDAAPTDSVLDVVSIEEPDRR